MKIKIAYDSKFSLSTTEGEQSYLTGMSVLSENPNKDTIEIFKKENNFLKNIKELNKYYPNYKYADITENTVLGILCRLVGEVRRLNVLENNHPIIKLKEKISFENINLEFQNEVMNLHTPLKEVQNGAGGIISNKKENHFLLNNNEISESLMSVFNYKTTEDIISYLQKLENDNPSLFLENYGKKINPLNFISEMSISEDLTKSLQNLSFNHCNLCILTINARHFWGSSESIDSFKNSYENYSLVIDAFNLQIKDKKNNSRKVIKEFEYLKQEEMNKMKKLKEFLNINEIFNISGFLFNRKIAYLLRNKKFENQLLAYINTKNTIAGIASTSGAITIKDFYNNFVDDKKTSFSMPYSVELKADLFEKDSFREFNVGTKVGVTKECGELTININVSYSEALKIYERIESAGVSTFQLGKKGLAYVKEINLENL